MHPKIKNRATTGAAARNAVQPPLRHDVTNLAGSANAASRRRLVATQPASGTANHARHHASPHAQS